jgi:hypothetical protein
LNAGLKKKTIEQIAEGRESKMSGADGTMLIGKNYFANPEVNAGFYSRKRAGVADVDPKVSYFILLLTSFCI